jgi:3-hydroxybutyrate dehydrogenase
MLKNKTVLITGSTSGIGLGIAQGFAKEGCNLILNGFGDAAEIETIRSGLEKEFNIRVIYDGADMSKADSIEQMMNHATQEFGGVDVLINNAGIQHVSPIEEFPINKWDAIIAINLSSAFHTSRLAIPYMKSKK